MGKGRPLKRMLHSSPALAGEAAHAQGKAAREREARSLLFGRFVLFCQDSGLRPQAAKPLEAQRLAELACTFLYEDRIAAIEAAQEHPASAQPNPALPIAMTRSKFKTYYQQPFQPRTLHQVGDRILRARRTSYQAPHIERAARYAATFPEIDSARSFQLRFNADELQTPVRAMQDLITVYGMTLQTIEEASHSPNL